MNYPYPTPTPYIQAAMSQAVQAIINGTPLPPNCLVMAVPYQQVSPMMPQIRMPHQALPAKDQLVLTQKSPYYGPSPYRNPPPSTRAPLPPQPFNYAIVPYMSKSKPKGKHRQPLHSNLYNSSSFDSYMRNLSWSRLFDHRPSQKTSKRASQDEAITNSEKKSSPTKKQESHSSLSSSSSSSSSTSSTTSDETIRRVTVTSRPPSNMNTKQQTKGSLPFKYSSEFLPGIGKQQVKPNDVFIINKA
ncbi:unnamed protein product [Adineta ricciae]|uniref:Uncharacterized protein n=1 Tax=Adineta ricciae TaxID=249248 RepID=A0A813X863_ADIRI|nr:unnamed protein product [Adineta ricciae]CAF1315721.1 unnamed protein product [Adineta ricciae]